MQNLISTESTELILRFWLFKLLFKQYPRLLDQLRELQLLSRSHQLQPRAQLEKPPRPSLLHRVPTLPQRHQQRLQLIQQGVIAAHQPSQRAVLATKALPALWAQVAAPRCRPRQRRCLEVADVPFARPLARAAGYVVSEAYVHARFVVARKLCSQLPAAGRPATQSPCPCLRLQPASRVPSPYDHPCP